MKLAQTNKAYAEIMQILKKHKELIFLDIPDVESKIKLHLLGIELLETYGLCIDPLRVNRYDWMEFGEHKRIGLYGTKHNRVISWLDCGEQPENEMLFMLKFPTGAFIFGYGGIVDKEYPVNFFNKFWKELLAYKPDYSDTANHCLYWKLENAKSMFNDFDGILRKYYDLNKEDVKQRKIESMKAELAKLENSK